VGRTGRCLRSAALLRYALRRRGRRRIVVRLGRRSQTRGRVTVSVVGGYVDTTARGELHDAILQARSAHENGAAFDPYSHRARAPIDLKTRAHHFDARETRFDDPAARSARLYVERRFPRSQSHDESG